MLAFLALIPIIGLMLALTIFKMPALKVAPIALLITAVLAFLFWEFSPVFIVSAAFEGVLFGLWPVGMIILGAITLSNLMIATGAVKQVEKMIGSISTDIRIVAVLVAWGLESFLEAIAGFGSGLALPIGILTAMGVHPFKAAIAALLANSVPTAYGGVGIGVITLADITSIPIDSLINTLAIQLFLPSLIMPFIITRVIAGSWQKTKEVFWVPLFAGLGQGIGLSLPIGASLIPIVSGLMNIGGGILAARIFYPQFCNKEIDNGLSKKDALISSSSFIIATVLILLTSSLFPMINKILGVVSSSITVYLGDKPKSLVFNWLMDAGVLLFISGIIGAYIQGASFKLIKNTIKNTLIQLKGTLIVLVSILALSRIMTYSGMIFSLSQGLATFVGPLYPLLSPILGTLGVFVTGSVVSSGILMGALQAEMGTILQINPAWLASMNITGATAGKMLAPHSVSIVLAAIAMPEEEHRIISFIFKVVGIYVGVMMIISYIGAKVF